MPLDVNPPAQTHPPMTAAHPEDISPTSCTMFAATPQQPLRKWPKNVTKSLNCQHGIKIPQIQICLSIPGMRLRNGDPWNPHHGSILALTCWKTDPWSLDIVPLSPVCCKVEPQWIGLTPGCLIQVGSGEFGGHCSALSDGCGLGGLLPWGILFCLDGRSWPKVFHSTIALYWDDHCHLLQLSVVLMLRFTYAVEAPCRIDQPISNYHLTALPRSNRNRAIYETVCSIIWGIAIL